MPPGWPLPRFSGAGSAATRPGAPAPTSRARTGATYTVTGADLGRTLRFRNDATDADGTSGSQSALVEPYIPFETRGSESLAAGDRVQNGVFVRNLIESRCGVPTSAPTILQATSNFLYDVFPVRSLLNESACLVARTTPASCVSGVSPSIYNPVFTAAAGLAANYAGNSGMPFNGVAAASVTLPAAAGREVVVHGGSSTDSCASYSVVLGADVPFATARPAIAGTPATGSALTATNGTWSGSPAFARSWRRCDAAGNACAAIPGATGASYAPTNADVGKRLRARVTATRGRSVSSDSAPSAIVPRPHGAGGDHPPRLAQPEEGGQRRPDPGQGDVRRGVHGRDPAQGHEEAGKEAEAEEASS